MTFLGICVLFSTRELLASNNIIVSDCANMHNTIPTLLITEHSCSKVTLILILLIFIVFTFGYMPGYLHHVNFTCISAPIAASLPSAYLCEHLCFTWSRNAMDSLGHKPFTHKGLLKGTCI
jgi:hypothetical protein